MSETNIEEDLGKQQIRCLVSNVYDLQKLRISAGNRLVQSFYISMGIKPSTSPDNADKEEKKLINKLKSEYKRITDAVVKNNCTSKSAINNIMKEDAKLNKDNTLKYITSDNLFGLVSSYMKLLESEEDLIKVLDKEVKNHPLWDAFFANIKGCGTLMSAVCIAYLDPYKAKYPSSFFRYCGLDTVQDEDKEGNKLYLEVVNGVVQSTKVREKKLYMTDDGDAYLGNVTATTDFDSEGERIYLGEDGEVLKCIIATKVINGVDTKIYEEVDTNNEYIGEVVVSRHGRRKGDTEMVEYIDSKGEKKLKRSITYNPLVKTKLMGVLAGCLLKAGGKGENASEYRKIYDDYRARLDNSVRHKDYSDAHKSMMAQHYMIKQFLRNLHTTWRQLEGLPIYEPYEVEKLGHRPHHLNEQQYNLAQKYK